MNIDILERYDKTDDGKYIVSIKADSYKALFNEYDFSSSFWKRDLREDFVAYLIDCVDEIGLKNNFILKVLLPGSENRDNNIEEKFNNALHHYFYYLIHLSKKEIKKILSRISFNFTISIALLSVSFITDHMHGDNDSFLYSLLSEGLYIAIWVLMWPVFSDFLFDLKESLYKIKIYKRVLKAEVIHEYL